VWLRRLAFRTLPLTIAVAVLLSLGIAGCQTTDSESEDEQTDQEESAQETTMTLSAYFVRDGMWIGVVRRTVSAADTSTVSLAEAAMEELLQGPTTYEADAGPMSTSIPADTQLNALTIEGDTATVDLSSDFEETAGTFGESSRLGQVVFTLTQFPDVERVEFLLDGQPVDDEGFGSHGFSMDEPVDRESFVGNVAPPILLESPALNDTVSSPLRLTGVATTNGDSHVLIDAMYSVQIVDPDGDVVYLEEHHTAGPGSDLQHPFAISIPYDDSVEGTGTVYLGGTYDGGSSWLEFSQVLPLEMQASSGP
jgi:spore germination protein GerM